MFLDRTSQTSRTGDARVVIRGRFTLTFRGLGHDLAHFGECPMCIEKAWKVITRCSHFCYEDCLAKWFTTEEDNPLVIERSVRCLTYRKNIRRIDKLRVY